jgi:hypothetical protein
MIVQIVRTTPKHRPFNPNAGNSVPPPVCNEAKEKHHVRNAICNKPYDRDEAHNLVNRVHQKTRETLNYWSFISLQSPPSFFSVRTNAHDTTARSKFHNATVVVVATNLNRWMGTSDVV